MAFYIMIIYHRKNSMQTTYNCNFEFFTISYNHHWYGHSGYVIVYNESNQFQYKYNFHSSEDKKKTTKHNRHKERAFCIILNMYARSITNEHNRPVVIIAGKHRIQQKLNSQSCLDRRGDQNKNLPVFF